MAYTLGVTFTMDTLSYLHSVSTASVSHAVRLAVAAWSADPATLLVGCETVNTTCTLDEGTVARIRAVALTLGVKEGKALRMILEDCARRTPRTDTSERRRGDRRAPTTKVI